MVRRRDPWVNRWAQCRLVMPLGSAADCHDRARSARMAMNCAADCCYGIHLARQSAVHCALERMALGCAAYCRHRERLVGQSAVHCALGRMAMGCAADFHFRQWLARKSAVDCALVLLEVM